MQTKPTRRSVDLSAYPDLTVIYLGLKVRGPRALKSMLRIGSDMRKMFAEPPDGLLRHETIIYGWGHTGMRQYWRDLESMERFTRSDPHRQWWRDFSRDMGGVGFWHETYSKGGGMEAVYVDIPGPLGLSAFAEARAPVGPFLTARERLAA